jgi:hypothetical protein
MLKFLFPIIFFIPAALLSQSFPAHHFRVSMDCSLTSVLSTNTDEGKVDVFQCMEESPSIAVYRINVISFNYPITELDAYFKNLEVEYASIGRTSRSTLAGKRAVEVWEDIVVEGRRFRQISVSTLYKNKAITLVLVTNSQQEAQLLQKFQRNFSLL